MVPPEVIREAQSGNQEALDASQEVLIRIYSKIGSYEEKAQFKTWVQRIVTNICIDKFRKAKPTVSIEEHDLHFMCDRNVEDEVMNAYLIEDIRKLYINCRIIIVLW